MTGNIPIPTLLVAKKAEPKLVATTLFKRLLVLLVIVHTRSPHRNFSAERSCTEYLPRRSDATAAFELDNDSHEKKKKPQVLLFFFPLHGF